MEYLLIAIICINRQEYDELEDRIFTGRKLAGSIAERYSNPKIHPVDGRIAIQIKDKAREFLTADELDRIVELPEDWTPVVEDV